MQPRIEPLGSQHDRGDFQCGNGVLDRYLRQQAGQDLRRHAAVPFVLVDPGTGGVAGYYTLSAYLIAAGELPAAIARRLPRYPNVPATLLGRLAVDRRYQGRGWGALLLVDALRRSWQGSQEVASLVVVVDAIDEAARDFYLCFGFIPFPGQAFKLFIPMDTVEQLFPLPG